MTEPKQLTPKQMYYAIQEDRMSSADFEEWFYCQCDKVRDAGFRMGYSEGHDNYLEDL